MDEAGFISTFLFTDIEGSTRLWEHEPTRMQQALAAHDHVARVVVEKRGGRIVKMTGDGMCAVFDDPLHAVEATLDFQQAIADKTQTEGLELRARCGIHVGVAQRRDEDYFGNTLNRAARIMSAAHGGQVLLSQAVVDLVRGRLPELISLRELGLVRLRDLASPERLYQLQHPSLRHDFPALRSLELTPNNLPQQATSFVGRERELDEVSEGAHGSAAAHARGRRGHRQDSPLAATCRRHPRRLRGRRVVRRARTDRRPARSDARSREGAGRRGGTGPTARRRHRAMGRRQAAAPRARQLRTSGWRLRRLWPSNCCVGQPG